MNKFKAEFYQTFPSPIGALIFITVAIGQAGGNIGQLFPSPIGELIFITIRIKYVIKQLKIISVPYRGIDIYNKLQSGFCSMVTLFPSPIGELIFITDYLEKHNMKWVDLFPSPIGELIFITP